MIELFQRSIFEENLALSFFLGKSNDLKMKW